MGHHATDDEKHDKQRNDSKPEPDDPKHPRRVPADELILIEHVPLHRAPEVGFARDAGVPEKRVERIELEDVPMFTIRRARRNVAAGTVLVQSAGAVPFDDATCVRRQIPQRPM